MQLINAKQRLHIVQDYHFWIFHFYQLNSTSIYYPYFLCATYILDIIYFIILYYYYREEYGNYKEKISD